MGFLQKSLKTWDKLIVLKYPSLSEYKYFGHQIFTNKINGDFGMFFLF